MDILEISLAERPELAERIGELEGESFPVYINEEPTWEACFPKILETQPELQMFLVDEYTDELLAVVCHCQLYWDGQTQHLPGYNQLLSQTLAPEEKERANMLCAIMGIIPEKYRGSGIPERIFSIMRKLGEAGNFDYVTSPIRPTLKQLYPNFSTEEYLRWKTPDGDTFDPWLRAQELFGGRLLAIAEDSISVSANLEQWQSWCGMRFPVSGDYVVDGGHKLLAVDLETRQARYGEDHIWYLYPNTGDDK